MGLTCLQAQDDTTKVKDIFDYTLDELMELEVSGVSRYKQSVSDVPNSIQVINHQQIIDRGYFDLSDILKDLQGFDVVSNAGQFGEFYSLRGISGNDRFLVLINGHKINPATGTHISIGNSISIRNAERVEVIYGPASAVYGADAFSGIINIVINDTAPEENIKLSGYANYGSLNSTDGALSGAFKLNKDFSFNFNARLYKSDGPNFENTDNTFYDYNVVNDYPKPLTNHFEQPTNDHNIYFNLNYKNFSVNYFRQQFEEGNALSFTPQIYIYNKENKWKTSTDIIWTSYKKQFNNDGNLSFDISYKKHTQDNNTIYYKWNTPGIFDANETYKQYMTGDDQSALAILTYNQLVTSNFQFIAGIENEYSLSIPPYANDEVLGESSKYEGENAKLINENLTLEENRFAGFGQFIFTPISSINIILGARYDYSSRYEGVFNPRAGLILSPTNSTKIKFIYGRAFQSPSLFVQYEQWGAPTIAMISMTEIQKTNPNWKLENQIVNSLELSITQNIGQNLKIKGSVYYNDLTNLIERSLYANDPTDSVYNKYFDSYTSGLRNENIGSQKIIGTDISLDAKIHKNIIIYSYYSYTDAKSINSDGGESLVPRISTHKVWAGITAQNLFNHITISPRFKWAGSLYNANTTIFPSNKQPGYYTLDLNLSANNLSKYFRIYADFENITNNKIEHGGLYEQSGVYTAVIPQQGFTFKAGIELFFNK